MVRMSAGKLNEIDKLIEKDIAEKKLPGAVVLVGRKGKIVYRKAFGNRSLVPTIEKMTVDTIFDVASLTKPVATATSIMILVERGQLRLNDTIGKFIPEIEDENAKRVTIQQLLTHVSGYQPDFDLREKWTGRDGMLQALYKEKLRNPAGTRFVYSDIGFIVLGEIVKRVSHQDLQVFSGMNIFRFTHPLDSLTFYRNNQELFDRNDQGIFALPGNIPGIPKEIAIYNTPTNSKNATLSSKVTKIPSDLSKIAPTENIKGQQNYLGSKFEGDEKTGNRMLRGQVHDPTAFRMGGVAGHAGLFSTADDLAWYCQMLLNGGTLDGKRILSANTIARMTAPYVISETGATRGLGWDMNSSFSANRGDVFPLGSFGHTGFTGTSIWIDRVTETFVVFLSNRVHPDGKGDVTPLRSKVATVVASAIEDVPIEKIREAEDAYSSQVAAQIPRFISQQSTVNSQQLIRNATVLNGIDVLEKNNFKELDGLKIGLVTNHTGKNLSGRQTIDVLKEAKNVKLVALFSPEHGIRGQLDQEKIVDSTDDRTGLPIYSLYGET
ncbi:MAG TPA: serine hydrolase, partial [Pyrinomonadaceae bacterium]|nr:serine hydrolase [Pyrinomonadaceae bacterium]